MRPEVSFKQMFEAARGDLCSKLASPSLMLLNHASLKHSYAGYADSAQA